MHTSKNGSHPKISVITVVYNAAEELQETIRTVVGQTYCDIEYIVIDGGSKDGTLDVINKNERYINKWISEPDNGIYDAMNKGVSLATGDLINFMNAGDSFYDESVVAQVASKYDSSTGLVIYGNHIVRRQGIDKHVVASTNIDSLWKGMIFCHQSAFVSRKLIQEEMFDSSLAIAADYKQILRLKDVAKFIKIDAIISKVSAGGVSDIKRVSSICERREVLKNSGDYSAKSFLYYKFEIAKQVLIFLIKNFWIKR